MGLIIFLPLLRNLSTRANARFNLTCAPRGSKSLLAHGQHSSSSL
jgi:hypothetical protein